MEDSNLINLPEATAEIRASITLSQALSTGDLSEVPPEAVPYVNNDKGLEVAKKNLATAWGQAKAILQNEEVDLSEVDVYLEELEGDALGKSTEDKAVIIDSRIALHPGMRQALLVSVFVHEGLHEKGEIPENLVRASVEEILNDPSQAKGGYKDGIKAAKKVAEAIGHGDLREGLMKLRDYYKKGEFNQLYIDFLNTFAGEEGVPVQAEDEELEVRRDEAYEIFKTAFPELSIVEAA